MNALETTNHARQRMAQRGLGTSDIDLLLQYATEVSDGYVMRDKDCKEAVCELKRLIDMVSRLSGKRLVVIDGALVTVYQADDRKVRQLLRDGPPQCITRRRGRRERRAPHKGSGSAPTACADPPQGHLSG